MLRALFAPFRRIGAVLEAMFPGPADDFGDRLLIDLGLKR
jgi:hypothetical protein